MSGARPAPEAGSGPLVKICGVTRVTDATHAVAVGADLLGLNFWPRSKRHVSIELAADLAAAARATATGGHPRIVGVFVDAELATIEVAIARVRLDIIQLHGAESATTIAAVAALGVPVWRAIAIASAADLDALDALDAITAGPAPAIAAVLLDTGVGGRAGSGTPFDWSLAALARARRPGRRTILAGGLTPHNVARAIATVAPYAVDVASGVESAPGIKDPAAVEAFIAATRRTPPGEPRRS